MEELNLASKSTQIVLKWKNHVKLDKSGQEMSLVSHDFFWE